MKSIIELERHLREGDNSAREELIIASMPLARKIANQVFQKFGGDADDYFQEAMVVVIDTIDNHMGNTRFSTTVNNRIRQHFERLLKLRTEEEKMLNHEISIDSIGNNRVDIILITNQRALQIDNILHQLDPMEEFVLKEYCGVNDGEPKTITMIGKRLGISYNDTRKIFNHGLSKLWRQRYIIRKLREYRYIEEDSYDYEY